MLQCVIFEDEHLLVVNKPAGLNTHAPSAYAGEGIYEWLRNREPRWANLAIIHRLDKETSGIMVFSKTPLANRSLTDQFTRHEVHKKYVLLTDRPVAQHEFTVRDSLARAGERYVSRPLRAGGQMAETRFRVLASANAKSSIAIEAEPLTGRTHQIRVHAAEKGFPILGDALYGGTPAPRVYLHAAEISLSHPASGQQMSFRVPVDFDADPRNSLRTALIEPELTNAYRIIHGASDGWRGWYVERLGDFLLSESEEPLSDPQREKLQLLMESCSAHGAYHKLLVRQAKTRTNLEEASPQWLLGNAAPQRFTILENGLRFELGFREGYSVGLFLDQRDNRRRLLKNHVGASFSLTSSAPAEHYPEVLNAFAYTCGFSVCAARAGAHTTSLDLSKKYLEWGKRNFRLNGLDPLQHDFIYGDVFDWLHRLTKKKRLFDIVVLDPPTFSQSKQYGVFRAKKDYGKLVGTALPLLKPGGVLFASSNAADQPPEDFLYSVRNAAQAAGREVSPEQYFPQPLDFPISRNEPPYLKTVWLRLT